MQDICSEIKLKIEKERRFAGVLEPVRGQVQVSNRMSTCVSLLTNSKDRGSAELANGRKVLYFKMDKWWGPVAEIGSSMRFSKTNATFIRLNVIRIRYYYITDMASSPQSFSRSSML